VDLALDFACLELPRFFGFGGGSSATELSASESSLAGSAVSSSDSATLVRFRGLGAALGERRFLVADGAGLAVVAGVSSGRGDPGGEDLVSSCFACVGDVSHVS
jgi:hypothetical protein